MNLKDKDDSEEESSKVERRPTNERKGKFVIASSKSSSQLAPRPLEEVDGNVEFSGSGPGVKAAMPNKLKRKMSTNEADARAVARRLDFTAKTPIRTP